MKAFKLLAIVGALTMGSAAHAAVPACSGDLSFGTFSFGSAGGVISVGGACLGSAGQDQGYTESYFFTSSSAFHVDGAVFVQNGADSGGVNLFRNGVAVASLNPNGLNPYFNMHTSPDPFAGIALGTAGQPTFAAGGVYELRFNWNTTNYLSATVRSVNGFANISAVPEPETYAMMLAGLGAIGFMARRRSSR